MEEQVHGVEFIVIHRTLVEFAAVQGRVARRPRADLDGQRARSGRLHPHFRRAAGCRRRKMGINSSPFLVLQRFRSIVA